jgi:hypothetical protein
MKIPPEPDQATLKKEDSRKPAPDSQNPDASNTAKDTSTVRRDNQPQSDRNEK